MSSRERIHRERKFYRMSKRRAAAIFLVSLGAALVLLDLELYPSLLEGLGFALLVVGFGLLNVDDRRHIILSCIAPTVLFFISLVVDYAWAEITYPRLGYVLVPFDEYFREIFNPVYMFALGLSVGIPFIAGGGRSVSK